MKVLLLTEGLCDFTEVLYSCAVEIDQMTIPEAAIRDISLYDAYCVLGPERVIDARVLNQLKKAAKAGKRVFLEYTGSFTAICASEPVNTTRSRLIYVESEGCEKIPGLTTGDLLDDESHRANAVVGDALLSLVAAGRGTDRIMADGVEVAVPSATFNALYLLRHAGLHFATERLLLRQVLDWGLMVQNSKGIDWDFVLRVVREQKMERFLDCMIEICVCDLGMDASCFPPFQPQGRLKDRVLGDILSPEFSEENDTVIGVNPRYIIYKVRRFVANRWKYRLVYPTSLWGIFWNLAWNRLRMLND